MKHIIEVNNNCCEKIFESFNDNLYIPASKTGKMTHTYIDNSYDLKIEDYNGVSSEIHTKSGIHLGDCDFTLSLSKQYLDFINNVSKGYIYKGMKNK